MTEPRPRRVIEAVTDGWIANSADYGDDAPADRAEPTRTRWTLRFDEALPLEVSLGLLEAQDDAWTWTFDRVLLSAALSSDEGATYYGEGDVRIGRVKWGLAFELRGHDQPPVLGVIPHEPAAWFNERITTLVPPDSVQLDVDALIAQLQGES